MRKFKQKLADLNNTHNNKKRKPASEGILLLIAELTAETNGNVKWLLWMVCAAFLIFIGILIKMAFG